MLQEKVTIAKIEAGLLIFGFGLAKKWAMKVLTGERPVSTQTVARLVLLRKALAFQVVKLV